jgi:pSer/pThr/pTyr-binding forkhead associated (FHA) protein
LATETSSTHNYICIYHPTIGRQHSSIERRHDGVWLRDLQSINGTYIDGQRIDGEVPLAHGARVNFDEFEFEFLLAGWDLIDTTIATSDFRRVKADDEESKPKVRSHERRPRQRDV